MKTLKERAQALLEKFNACKGAEERKNLGWELAEFVEELANAPVAEPEPVGEAVDFNGWRIVRWKVKESSFPLGTKFYTAPPAPSVQDEVPDAVIDAVADAIGRVWSAWEYGTMGPDDFLPVTDDADRVAEIARAALSSWLATAPTPAEAPADVARDAERWRMLPAFLEEFEISYLRLEDAIDAAIEREILGIEKEQSE